MGNRIVIKITDHKDLREMTTFGLPAECGRLIEYDTAADLQELRNAGMLKETMPIGGGSNILFTTGRFNGTVLHCNNTTVKHKPFQQLRSS